MSLDKTTDALGARVQLAQGRKTIARILKVNHAGEYGAIRIYRSQIAVARWIAPQVVSQLSGMLAHEIRHCETFSQAMPMRAARPCRVMSLWSWGGTLLGAMTALLGERYIWICTAAVEETVHRHLEEQLAFVDGRDAELHAQILAIRAEELEHLQTARDHLSDKPTAGRWLFRLVAVATGTVIWLSTWGDSTRMARELAEAKLT